MSRVDFTRIYGRNFNSLGEFDLPITPGKHLIIGEILDAKSSRSNGSGKSSLMETIPWTIYKKYLRGKDPSRDGKGNCMTGVEWAIDGKIYAAERYHKDKKIKNASKILVNGEDISPRLDTMTDEEIQKLVNIPADLFVSTCVVMQGLPINFTQFTPTIRKGIIEDAIGSFVWDEFRKKFGGEMTEKMNKLTELKREYDIKYNEMVNLNAQLEASKTSAVEQIQKADQELANADKIMKQTKEELAHANQQLKNKLGEQTQQDLEQEMSSKNSSLSLMRKRIQDLDTIVNDKDCPTCNRPYPESQIAEAEKEFNMLKSKVERLQASFDETNCMYRDVLECNKVVTTKVASVQNAKNNYKQWVEYKAQLEQKGASNTDELQEKLNILNTEVNTKDTEIKEIQAEYDGIQFIDQQLLPSSAFRTEVLKKYLDQITAIVHQLTPLIFEDVEVALVVDKKATGVDIEIKRNGRKVEYKSLSGGQKRRLDILIIFAFQRFLMEASGINTNLVVFDEIFEGLDSQGVQSVLSCLDMLFDESMAIYVITHNDSFKSQFDSIIKVIMKNGVSTLAS